MVPSWEAYENVCCLVYYINSKEIIQGRVDWINLRLGNIIRVVKTGYVLSNL